MDDEERPRILVAKQMFDDNKVFELMERESVIRGRLTEDFHNIAFLWAAEDQLAWIGRNHELLMTALLPAPGGIRSRIIAMRADVLFHFGNYLASVSAGVDFLYNNGKGTFPTRLLDEIHARTDHLKKSAPQRIMTALRHRQQHAPPVIDRFNVQERTRWHTDGEGVDLCPTLTNRTVAAVEAALPSFDDATSSRWSEIKSALEVKKDWLTPLLNEHWTEVTGAFQDCQAAVRTTYADEIKEYERLRTELNDVEVAFKAMGIATLP